MTAEQGPDGARALNPSGGIPTSDFKCEICTLLWTVEAWTLNGTLRAYRDKKYCKNCFEYIQIQSKPCDILSDPYDVRNWTGVQLPIHLFHCCGCFSVYNEHILINNSDGLVELQIFKPYCTHAYCIHCFLNRVHNPEKGLSPFGCCMKWMEPQTTTVVLPETQTDVGYRRNDKRYEVIFFVKDEHSFMQSTVGSYCIKLCFLLVRVRIQVSFYILAGMPCGRMPIRSVPLSPSKYPHNWTTYVHPLWTQVPWCNRPSLSCKNQPGRWRTRSHEYWTWRLYRKLQLPRRDYQDIFLQKPRQSIFGWRIRRKLKG